ncbi:MAG: hypothetical protein JRI73_14245 [Deltaproteobacteria bacterium]|nr:hypothetical protein [Deltaproteobacteria bacterium]
MRQRFEDMGDEIKTLEKSMKEIDDEQERGKIESRIDRLQKSHDSLGERLEVEQAKTNGKGN